MGANSYGDTSTISALPASIYVADKAAYGLAAGWQEQQLVYSRVWPYFSGAIFDSHGHSDASGAFIPDFPLRINHVRKACVTHALHLWGLTGNGPHVRFTVVPRSAQSESRQNLARTRADNLGVVATDFFNFSSHPTLLREASRMFNIFGGVYLRPTPDPRSPYGISLGILSPEHVYPVFDPINYNRLLRIHVVTNIDAELARTVYGYRGDAGAGRSVEYIESWSEQAWQISLGMPGSSQRQIAVDPNTNELLAGENRFIDPVLDRSLIPIVYIPRLRTGRFFGLSLADELTGMQDEFNSRMADYGDIVHNSAQDRVWGTDLSRRPRSGPLRLWDPGEIFDAGDTSVNGKTPALNTLSSPAPSQGTASFTDKLEEVMYDQASISPVMRGVDEGSQRSGVTLAARAIPTTAMVDDYRTSWACGIVDLWYLTMCWAFNYNRGMFGDGEFTKAEFGHRVQIGFAPVLPRDTEAINQTIQIGRSTTTMSTERAVRLSPDVDNPEEELQRIAEEQEEKQQQVMDQAEHQTELAIQQQAARPKPDLGGKSGDSKAG